MNIGDSMLDAARKDIKITLSYAIHKIKKLEQENEDLFRKCYVLEGKVGELFANKVDASIQAESKSGGKWVAGYE